ncbi:MAG: MFS transporter [Anaerolineales bacterium]|nr:MFS transporter [Anaerolineales bacterium]
MASIESIKSFPIPGEQRRGLSIASLSAATLVDQGEEQALPILWSHMYASLGASIGGLGAVLGASKIAMTAMYPVWGYLADRFSRRMLLVWFTGIWGLWTLGISFAETLPQLMTLRLISGLGLGAFAPAAFSLIGDLFDNESRGRAIGITRAVGLSGIIFVVGLFPAVATQHPENWRLCFAVMGIASFLTGLFMLMIREPARGASEPELRDVITDQNSSRYMFAGSDFWALFNIRSWCLLLVNDLLTKVSIVIFTGWNFTWLNGLGLATPVFYGTILVVFAGMTVGSIFFGWLGDRLEGSFPNRGRITMIQIGLMIGAPSVFCYLSSTGENIIWLIAFAFLGGVSNCIYSEGTLWPVAHSILPPEIRGSNRAIISMIGGVVSAVMLTLSGIVADRVGVFESLLWFVPLPLLISAIAWMPMFRTYPQDRSALHNALMRRRADLSHPSSKHEEKNK